jgi:hypothetical protein
MRMEGWWLMTTHTATTPTPTPTPTSAPTPTSYPHAIPQGANGTPKGHTKSTASGAVIAREGAWIHGGCALGLMAHCDSALAQVGDHDPHLVVVMHPNDDLLQGCVCGGGGRGRGGVVVDTR